MHAEPPSVAAAIVLARGGSRRFHGRAGDRISVSSGALRLLDPPDWLAETMVHASRILAAEDSHVLEHDGWYEAQALAATRLLIEAECSPPESWRATCIRLWRALLARAAALVGGRA